MATKWAFVQSVTGVFTIGPLVISAASPNFAINAIINTINAIVGITAVIATMVIVYAAVLMIANVGNEEQYTKAKGLMIRVAIGIMVIIVSAGLINVVLAI